MSQVKMSIGVVILGYYINAEGGNFNLTVLVKIEKAVQNWKGIQFCVY